MDRVRDLEFEIEVLRGQLADLRSLVNQLQPRLLNYPLGWSGFVDATDEEN